MSSQMQKNLLICYREGHRRNLRTNIEKGIHEKCCSHLTALFDPFMDDNM